jgi:hypothetical protein
LLFIGELRPSTLLHSARQILHGFLGQGTSLTAFKSGFGRIHCYQDSRRLRSPSILYVPLLHDGGDFIEGKGRGQSNEILNALRERSRIGTVFKLILYSE